MDIDAGFKVNRRITDEQRRKKFLQVVVDYFKNDPRVCMEVKINFDTHTVQHTALSPNIWTQIENDIRLFHLTEAFNFVPGDDSILGFWNTQFRTQPNQLNEEKNDEQEAELMEATLVKLRSEVIRLNYTDVNVEQLISRRFLHPEQAIVFHVGETPDLPLYGHHFKGTESKITGGGLMADIVFEGVYKLLEQFFPGHTQYWTEFEDEEDYRFNDRVSYESQDETDQFYRTLIESTNKKDEMT